MAGVYRERERDWQECRCNFRWRKWQNKTLKPTASIPKYPSNHYTDQWIFSFLWTTLNCTLDASVMWTVIQLKSMWKQNQKQKIHNAVVKIKIAIAANSLSWHAMASIGCEKKIKMCNARQRIYLCSCDMRKECKTHLELNLFLMILLLFSLLSPFCCVWFFLFSFSLSLSNLVLQGEYSSSTILSI